MGLTDAEFGNVGAFRAALHRLRSSPHPLGYSRRWRQQLRRRLSAKDAVVSPDAAIGKLTLKEATDDLLNDHKVNGRRSLPEVRRKVELQGCPTSASDGA